MKNLYTLLILFYITFVSSQVTIKGKVIAQGTNQPLEFATVIFFKTSSKEIVTGTITNEKGEYELSIKKDSYDIRFEFIGFTSHEMKNNIFKNNVTLPTIALKENTEQLDNIDIVATKSSIEYKLDKRIFNVGQDLLSKGGSASDILNNVPSVNVDIEGEVSLRGNANVRILINGRPSVLTNNNGLEQIPAETIEKVEIITNPSAKYDAEGTAGILNIILKKNKTGGFSSSLQLTTGYPTNTGINYNANYKTEKFNLFSNLRYRDLKFIGEGNLFRTNYTNNTVNSFLDEDISFERKGAVFNLYIGSDYYYNDKNTTTFSYFYIHNTNTINTNYELKFLDTAKNINSISNNNEAYKEPQIVNILELNHVKTFDKKGQKLTLDFQYTFWNDDENALIIEESNAVTNTLKSRDIESSKDFLFQTDLKLPITEKSHFEIGLKGEIRNIDSDYEVFDNTIAIDSLTNLLYYKERIYGVYAQYGNKQNKLQYLVGLRAENSSTGSTDRNNEFNINKNYTNLFPTLHLTYNFNEKTNLQLSYSRRITRPSFRQLNPFTGIADRLNIEIGNPDLDPMFTNALEIGFLKKWQKFTLNPSIYYKRTTQLFETQITVNNTGAIISKPINSGIENTFGTEIALQFSPYKWWRLSNEYNFYTFKQQGVYILEDNTWFTRLNSRVKLLGFTFQNSFNYRSQINSGQTLTKSIYWTDLGISRDFLNDKASIVFNFENIFDSRIQKEFITGESYDIEKNINYSGRRFKITFIYKFNRNKKDRDRLPD